MTDPSLGNGTASTSRSGGTPFAPEAALLLPVRICPPLCRHPKARKEKYSLFSRFTLSPRVYEGAVYRWQTSWKGLNLKLLQKPEAQQQEEKGDKAKGIPEESHEIAKGQILTKDESRPQRQNGLDRHVNYGLMKRLGQGLLKWSTFTRRRTTGFFKRHPPSRLTGTPSQRPPGKRRARCHSLCDLTALFSKEALQQQTGG